MQGGRLRDGGSIVSSLNNRFALSMPIFPATSPPHSLQQEERCHKPVAVPPASLEPLQLALFHVGERGPVHDATCAVGTTGANVTVGPGLDRCAVSGVSRPNRPTVSSPTCRIIVARAPPNG
jgi:hypothetical protein